MKFHNWILVLILHLPNDFRQTLWHCFLLKMFFSYQNYLTSECSRSKGKGAKTLGTILSEWRTWIRGQILQLFCLLVGKFNSVYCTFAHRVPSVVESQLTIVINPLQMHDLCIFSPFPTTFSYSTTRVSRIVSEINHLHTNSFSDSAFSKIQIKINLRLYIYRGGEKLPI